VPERAEDAVVSSRPRRSPSAVLGLLVFALAVGGFAIQTGYLARTVSRGFHEGRRELRPLLDAAGRVMPPRARFASNVYASGYVLYPRRRIRIRFAVTPVRLRRRLRITGVNYLVMAFPLPPSLTGPATWRRRLYRDRLGVVLEVR
jgi:hypothetical protein